MNKEEMKFFRYLCKQADYSKSYITIGVRLIELPDVLDDITFINIIFKDDLRSLILNYCSRNEAKPNWCFNKCKYWLRNHIMHTDLSHQELAIIVSSRKDKQYKYFDLVPKRVVARLNHNNINDPSKIELPEHRYLDSNISGKERQLFRYIFRHLDENDIKNACQYQIFGQWCMVIDVNNIHELINQFINYSGIENCSKNEIKRIISKWVKKKILYWDRKKQIECPNDEEEFCKIAILSSDDKKYYNAIPKNVMSKFEKERIIY